LLDEISLKGARGVLINITGSHDLTLFELDEAANRIREEVDPDANIIVGSTLDTEMEGSMRVSVVATGIDATNVQSDTPMPRRSMAAPLRQTVSVEERAGADAEAQASAAETAPAPAPAPAVAAEPTPEPAAVVDEEPNLFANIDDSAERAEIPAPVYQSEVPAFEPRADAMDPQIEEPKPYVAPEPSMRGVSPHEDIRVSGRTGHGEGIGLGPADLGRGREAATLAPRGEPRAEEKRSFGLNSLISRMTGNASDQPAKAPRPAPVSSAPAAPVRKISESFDADTDANEDRIEIPAFLRRQAN